MNRLIVNADDFGISHEVNEAISLCFMKGYINQTTIMVNMPFFCEAIEMAKKYAPYYTAQESMMNEQETNAEIILSESFR